ncbi:hypothetical protein HW44_03865 [Nitrosococcus oceani]|nr:hypothetical protein HW44_03865 [Nitrosococcus oceani]
MTSQHGVIKDVSCLSATISITDCSGRLDGKFREISGSYFTAQGIKKSGKTGTQQGSDIESRQVLPLRKTTAPVMLMGGWFLERQGWPESVPLFHFRVILLAEIWYL